MASQPTNGAGVLTTPALAFLGGLANSEDVDFAELLRGYEAETPPDEAVRPGQRVPGAGTSPGLDLTADEKKLLAGELCDLCDRYDDAADGRNEQEQEIRDAYALAGPGEHAGTSPLDARMVSEMLMVQVDQVTARIVTNLLSVSPIVKIDPVLGSAHGSPDTTDLAKTAQGFLNDYVMQEMDFRHLLPRALHRAVKVGTAVFRLQWEKEERVRFNYPTAGGEAVEQRYVTGNVKARLIENRLVKVWPVDLPNWQTDYDFVGHESWHSRSSWKRLAADWGLDEETIRAVEGAPGEPNEALEANAARHGMDTSALEEQKLLSPQVRITELWCNLCPPGHEVRQKFQVMLHRPTQRILWIDRNRHFSQRHPYFPVRYKWGDESAFGTGVGHESLMCWSGDTALWNLSLDNLAAGAFSIVVRNAGFASSTLSTHIRPGAQVMSENPEKDYIVRKLGGDAEELPMTRAEIEMRVSKATGTPAVSMGMGDPTMKSGAGTGSTLALIQQASMKIRMVDGNVREDLSDVYGFSLELVAQFGTDGLFYNRSTPEDAQILRRLRYYPPHSGDVSQMFRIRAAAPSASSSDEARRNSYMVVWGFAQEAIQAMEAVVVPLLQQENPAAIPRWMHRKAAFMGEMQKRVIELHEIPGVLDLLPEIPPPQPPDQIINNLEGQLAQAQGMLQELQGFAQQLMAEREQHGLPPLVPQMQAGQAGQPTQGAVS